MNSWSWAVRIAMTGILAGILTATAFAEPPARLNPPVDSAPTPDTSLSDPLSAGPAAEPWPAPGNPAAPTGPAPTPEGPGWLARVRERTTALLDGVGTAFDGLLAEVGGGEGGSDDKGIVLYQNDVVRKFKRFYLEVEPDVFQTGLERAERYIPMIRRLFREEGLPEELACLAIVESNLNPLARSPKWAVGLWQFMPETARRFGLSVSPWYDERLDPALSTQAAARMLRYLHDRFGNWELALAAYNAGEGRVNQAIRANRLRGREDDYWSLRLPRQTKRYVPAFLALALVYNDLEGHGFSPLGPEPTAGTETVRGEFFTTLGEIARRLGLPEENLAELNPAWKQRAVPPAQIDEVVLRLPAGYPERLSASIAKKPLQPPKVVTHRVTAGETLSQIARQYGVAVSDLLMVNEIPNRHLLKRGQKLIIPLARAPGGVGRSREV